MTTATTTTDDTEIEIDGIIHVIRTTPTHVWTGRPALAVDFWGRDAWLPAGTVLGRDDDSCDTAVRVGVRASTDYRAGRSG